MNKPYTCHNCDTVFDALPDSLKEEMEVLLLINPDKIKVKCPGCYSNGYTSEEQMIYTLDTSGDATLVE